jgi:hypothetical protein
MSTLKANAWQRANGTVVGTVLQTLANTNADPIAVSASSTWYDVCSVTITPASSSNKCLLLFHLTGVTSGSWDRSEYVLRRSGTNIAIGSTSGGGQTTGKLIGDYSGNTSIVTYGGCYLDTPATTSAITYTLSVRDGNVDTTMWINRAGVGVGSGNQTSTVSTLVVQEIQA